MTHTVPELCRAAECRIDEYHVACFRGHQKPLFLISDTYPGIWLEHVYDSVLLARMYPERLPLAVNTVRLFLRHQTPDGQLPCYIWDAARVHVPPEALVGYGQTQECVSFAALCLETAEMANDPALLSDVYAACSRWDGWLRRNRMTTGRGLVEMFVGYDTGHDNSGRLAGMAHPGYHTDAAGRILNAACPPDDDGVAPILAVDMNCNLYGSERALAEMARRLGRLDEAGEWEQKAADVKRNLFKHCFCPEDGFFYDADRSGNLRKYRSSTILHLFLERVLDPDADAALIERIVSGYLRNPDEFWTPYPYPSMSASDPSTREHADRNCWGYFSEALIALRCTRWMDFYGLTGDFDLLLRRWLDAWTDCFDHMKFGQELDPFTGVPSPSSEWYSSCMLLYLYAARRLGLD